MDRSRRFFLAGSAGLGVALAPPSVLAAADLVSTPILDMGPFYPVRKPIEQDADLTRLAGHSDRARGQLVELTGRVLRRDGQPVGGARVEIWQANAAGRYSHPGDTHDAPLDPNFQGYGVQTTQADGHFRFLTVKPGAYPGWDFLRSPHIHFDVSGKVDRLVTQMYFPGEPLLRQDKRLAYDLAADGVDMTAPIFGVLGPGPAPSDPAATLCVFDIVLNEG